ncbi:basement membrane proteoglycan-like [Wyeomyia smithii]|uniref:basement membrane proteoglycan-like n=1 Tax=Wyeomyia smithii TaxID=174621 RepID=UPI002467BC74|nr:basement membrane proteoglycan-like [Wyeomyia smithii]
MWFAKISVLAFPLLLVGITASDFRIAPDARLALRKRSTDVIRWCEVFYQEDFPPNTSCEGREDNVWDYFPACCNGAFNCRSGFIWDVYLCAPYYVYDVVQDTCVRLEGDVCPYFAGGTTTPPPVETTTATTEESTTITEEPTTITEEPTTITEEPTTITEEPTTITEEPTTITEEPTTITEEPTTIITEEITTEEVGTETDTTNEESTTEAEEPTTELAETTEPPIISCETMVNGKLPHPTDCKKYILCLNSNPTVEDCYEGYIFYIPFLTCLPGDGETCELYKVEGKSRRDQ